MKIRKFEIKNYKIFKKINMDFTDKKNMPLPIIIIAGINGTGKTTILEYLYNCDNYYFRELNQDSMEFECDDKIVKLPDISFESKEYLKDIAKGNFKGNSVQKIIEKKIIYLSANKGVEDIKEFLPKYLFQKIFNEKADVEESYKEVRDYINTIFKDLNIKIEFDSRDAEGNLFFRNKKEEVFSIDDISTGEKTLLSKVLYLYLKEIKDSVILIDEPELSLHPSWQNKILKLYENFAKENNCQIIIATHSPHIIGSAKSEYLRILTEDGVIDNFSKSYGLEFDKILTDIMGVENLRTPDVAQKIRELWKMLEDEEYEDDKYQKLYTELELLLGSLDQDLILARLEVAKLKSQNV